MCRIYEIEYTQCLHREQQLRRCQVSFDNARWKDEQKRKRSWFKNLFPSSTRSKEDGCDCTTTRVVEDAVCSSCSAEVTGRTPGILGPVRGDADDKAKEAYDKYEAEQRTKTEEQAKRAKFVCSSCADDGRDIKLENRNFAVNGGLCCAQGLEEYQKQQRREQMHGRSQLGSQEVARGKSQKHGAAPWDKTLAQVPAKQGSETSVDGRRSSADISTALLKDYLSIPGSRLSALRPSMSPRYTEPGIDWARWAEAVQTHHGRYPPAGPPPKKPLPQLPRTRAEQGTQAERHDRHSAGDEEGRDKRSSALQLPPIRSVSPIRMSKYSIYPDVQSPQSPRSVDQARNTPPSRIIGL